MASQWLTPGALIAIEGLDGSGKTLQSERLVAALRLANHEVASFSFPDYGTQLGLKVGKILSEVELDDEVMDRVFSANQFERREAIELHLSSGTHVVIDCYIGNRLAYGSSSSAALCVGLPVPTVSVLLDVDPNRYAGHGWRSARAHASLLDQTQQPVFGMAWSVVDGNQAPDAVHTAVCREAFQAIARAGRRHVSRARRV